MASDSQTFLELARQRRTTRSYREDPVTPEMIELILEAGRWAPSAANTQPWELIIVQDRQLKGLLKQAFLDEAASHGEHYRRVTRGQGDLLTAPLLLAVCGDDSSKELYVDFQDIPDASREELFQLSMGAMIQNMLLAAASLGLGSTWMARPARVPEIRRLLAVPDRLRLVALLAFGFPKKAAHFSQSLRKDIRKKTHVDSFATEDPADQA